MKTNKTCINKWSLLAVIVIVLLFIGQLKAFNLSQETAVAEPKRVFVNEISGNDKWLEIYNDETEAVDLSGYILRKIDEDDLPVDWKIPNGTVIPAKSFRVWTQNASCSDGSTFTWGISGKKDVAFKLFDAENNELDFFEVKMSAGLYSEGSGKTVGRKTDGARQLVVFYSGGTKNASNNTGITTNPATILYPQLTNLPTVYINTKNAASITNKTDYVSGSLVVVSSDGREELLGDGSSGVPMEIRGRGNSTWGMAKKPYRIKFASKTNFLNLPAKAKSWTLLANYADKSLIRNGVAFKMSEITGLAFSPSARFVDVVLNGNYIGNYMVSDQVQVNQGRVEVDELTNAQTTLPDISGGYLLEIDGFASSEPVWFTTSQSLKITVKSPDDDQINAAQLNYIKTFTQKFEDALFSSQFKDPELGYRALVDSASLINWYICCEFTGNSDSFWSTYIYKKRGIDKFFFGPLWDYDIAFNNDSRLGDAVEKLMRENAHSPRTWIQRMWEDEWFRNTVTRRWNQLMNEEKIVEKLLTYIDETASLIDASQRKNYEKWGKLSSRVYLEQFIFSTYQEYVAYLNTYISQRASFLSRSFNESLPPGEQTSFIAENFYYMILNVGSNNAVQVKGQSMASNVVLEMWNPQPDDANQEWTILPVGNDKYQIVNRHSNLAMTGNGRAANLIQLPSDVNNTAQLWYIMPVGTSGCYGLINVKSGMALDNSGGSTNNGTPAIEYDNNYAGNRNQQWYIQKTDELIKTKYRIRHHATGLYLGNHPAEGKDAYAYVLKASDDDIQSFFLDLVPGETDVYYIRQVSSGWYLRRNTSSSNWATGWTENLSSMQRLNDARFRIEPSADDPLLIQLRNLGGGGVLGTDELIPNSKIYADKNGTNIKFYWVLEQIQVEPDKQTLYARLQEAGNLIENTETGTAPNQYPPVAREAFERAVADAQAVYDTAVEQDVVDKAANVLETAIETYKNSKNQQAGIGQYNPETLSVVAGKNTVFVNHLTGLNKIAVYTVAGQLIHSVNTNGNQLVIHLNPGSYIVSVAGDVRLRKIVVVF